VNATQKVASRAEQAKLKSSFCLEPLFSFTLQPLTLSTVARTLFGATHFKSPNQWRADSPSFAENSCQFVSKIYSPVAGKFFKIFCPNPSLNARSFTLFQNVSLSINFSCREKSRHNRRATMIDTTPPFVTVRDSVLRGFPAANRLNSII
jgi:hypothetical protein